MKIANKIFSFWNFVICVVFILFFPSLTTYFVQDDFWLLAISKVRQISDFGFLFIPRTDAVWYRPLSSQIFFAFGQWVFGLNPIPYHMLVFITHFFTAWCLYRLLLILKQSRETGWLTAFLYLTHQAHVISLSWLAAYSFILGPLLIVLTLIFFLQKKYVLAFIMGTLGAMTNEVNLLVPFFLLPFIDFNDVKNRNKNCFLLVSFALMSILVVFLRKIAYPSEIITELYRFHISVGVFSTLKFYILRLISVPLLFDEMSLLSQVGILFLVLLFIGTVSLAIAKSWIKEKRLSLLFLYLTGIGVAPFIFLADHLAPHYLSFSLLGWSAFMAFGLQAFLKGKKWLYTICIGVYLIVQFFGSQWTYKTHWLFTRAKLAQTLVSEEKLMHPIGSEEFYSLGANAASEVFTKK